MNTKHRLIAVSLLAPLSLSSWAQAASFSTLITTPLAIEGLTNDNSGNLYTPGRSAPAGAPCPVWRINIASPTLVVVGNIPAPSPSTQCSPSGLAFDRAGKLYVTEGDKIYSFIPNSGTPPTATLYASGVPGTNGIAFDRDGNLWTGDGTTGQGRIWKINSLGVVTEMFRVQPMANEVNLVGGVGGVGRDVRTLPPAAITVTPTSRSGTATTLGSQPLVANGVQFAKDDDLLIADTARGAIWKVQIDRGGTVRSKMGCDTTFTPNTLCLENNILIQHPLLEGADGFVLDEIGNIWVSANERNAIVAVTDKGKGKVVEVFRNPPDATTKLRNTGPLETPTSPAISGSKLCTANSDGNRRDNSPNAPGDITGAVRGKISCMNERLQNKGASLPVR